MSSGDCDVFYLQKKGVWRRAFLATCPSPPLDEQLISFQRSGEKSVGTILIVLEISSTLLFKNEKSISHREDGTSEDISNFISLLRNIQENLVRGCSSTSPSGQKDGVGGRGRKRHEKRQSESVFEEIDPHFVFFCSVPIIGDPLTLRPSNSTSIPQFLRTRPENILPLRCFAKK